MEYKLQEIKRNSIFFNQNVKRLLLIIWLVSTIYFIIKVITISEIEIKILMLTFIFAYCIFFGAFVFSVYSYPIINSKNKKLKAIGKKMQGYIIDAENVCMTISTNDFLVQNSRKVFKYWITIRYEERNIKIYRIKDNEAYRVLKILLDLGKYPIQRAIKIPIDIYVYKNEIYADLDSVDLTVVEGFEKAKKLVSNR